MKKQFCFVVLLSMALSAQAQTPGTTNWVANFGTGIRSYAAPSIGSNGVIYVAAHRLDPPQGFLYSLNPNGTTNWIAGVGTNSGGYVNASPVISTNGTIYQAGKAHGGITPLGDSDLYSITPDGRTNWVATVSASINVTPVLGLDGTIYVAVYDSINPVRLYSINSSGTTNWVRQINDSTQVTGQPAIGHDGCIYIPAYQSLYAFRADGTTNWIAHSPAYPFADVSVGTNGLIYTCNTSNELYALNAGNGTTNFTSTTNADYGITIGYDGTLYSSAGMNLYSLSAMGQTNWTVYYGGMALFYGSALGSDNILYVVSSDGNLYALSTVNGSQLWSACKGNNSLAPVLGTNGVLYTAGDDGDNLYAIQASGHLDESAPWPIEGHDLKHTGHPSPPTPFGVSASLGASTAQVQLNWNAVSNTHAYEVGRFPDGNPSSVTVIGCTNGTSLSDTSAVPGSLYYYQVRAVNHAGRSPFSTACSGYRQLSPPASLIATDGAFTDRVRLTWTASSYATAYEVWRSPENTSGSGSRISESVTTNTYDDTGVTVNTIYYYWVKAKTSAATSDFSNVDSGSSTNVVILPRAPSVLSASQGTYSNKILVSWDASQGASSYELYCGFANDSTNATLQSELSLVNYEHANVTPSSMYYYWVKAKNSAGTSGFSTGAVGYAGSSPQRIPVYRLYSYGAPESTFEHLFTINEMEKDVLSTWPSWQYEGVGWYALGAAVDEAVPLYRLYAPSVRQHHYTIDPVEYELNADNGTWNGEGIQYYVYAERTGTTAVFRFYHPELYLHHFTISVEERDNIDAHPEWGYTFEAIAYYVFTSP